MVEMDALSRQQRDVKMPRKAEQQREIKQQGEAQNGGQEGKVVEGGRGTVQGKKDPYIPRDADGNPIPLAKQRVNGQDIPLPDPEATGPHTVLGGKVSSETGKIYRQSATFPEGTWPLANGQNVPWSEVHWNNHGRGDHTNPHQHIFEYNPDKGGWIRGDPSYFKD